MKIINCNFVEVVAVVQLMRCADTRFRNYCRILVLKPRLIITYFLVCNASERLNKILGIWKIAKISDVLYKS